MNFLRAIHVSAWLGILLVATMAPALSAELSITPLRTHLDSERPIQSWTMQNHGAEAASFEVRVKRWTQASDGRWELADSEDLVVSPLIFSIAPGGKAQVRVGTLSPSVEREQAYRVELQELPGERVHDGRSEVRLLTRFSLPVFVQPVDVEPGRAVLVSATIGASSLGVTIGNEGGSYLPRQEGRVQLFDAAGGVIHEDVVGLEYVLAGARLPLRLALPAGLCGRAVRVELELPGQQPMLRAGIDAASRQCND